MKCLFGTYHSPRIEPSASMPAIMALTMLLFAAR
jgi:hypothetical protein